MTLHIVILAAGQGKRMHSNIPKVLHKIGGKPMLSWVVDTALQLNPEKIHVIIGNKGDEVKNTLSSLPVNWITQDEQLGTGHAVKQALPFIPKNSQVLVLYADVPLIRVNTLQGFIDICQENKTSLGLLVAKLENPYGLGRVKRDKDGLVQSIIEEKDATSSERGIKEIYTGICYASIEALNKWLPNLNRQNAQREYYLTDIILMAIQDKLSITTFELEDIVEITGVNNLIQLQELERIYQLRSAKTLLANGVNIADCHRIDIRGNLNCGTDCFIDINSIFEGTNSFGDNCIIGPNCYLKNVTLGNNCHILANSYLEDCIIGDNCKVGPFARMRTGTKLAANCKIGNFVETKNTKFAENSKASHLSYIGDTIVGKHVNIGAGTITCNYDGVNKHQTIIEDNVFIGSDTQLIAPVKVGKNSTIGAGSTIYKDVPEGELTLTEAKQKTIPGWKKPKRET